MIDLISIKRMLPQGRLASWNEANPLDQRSLDAGGVFPQLDKSEQVHILAVIPQIFVITCGEIMCSITGLEFAYAYVRYTIVIYKAFLIQCNPLFHVNSKWN